MKIEVCENTQLNFFKIFKKNYTILKNLSFTKTISFQILKNFTKKKKKKK